MSSAVMVDVPSSGRDNPPSDEQSNSDKSVNEPLAHAGMLEDHFPEQWRVTSAVTILTLVLALVYILLSYFPLWHTDLWGHLSYGRWIAQTGQIPHTEPLMPLSSGVPFVDTAWLSQWLGYQAYQIYELAALQGLFAIGITGCLSLFVWNSFRRTESIIWTLAGLAVLIGLNWMQWNIARPQIAGQFCFLGLVMQLTARRRLRWQIVGIPLLFALWANLHGSFIVGLACLAASAVGRACDMLRRTMSIKAVWRDPYFKRELLLLELAATAVLINPYGLGLYREVLSFTASSNLRDLIEWQPLTLQMKQGKIFVAVVIGLMMILRYSPRRISAREWLWLVGLGCATLWSSRLIVWWAPWAAWFFVVHGQASWRILRSEPRTQITRLTSGKWTVATLGLIWIAFAYAPLGGAVMHGRQPELKRSVTRQTPLGAVEYLHEHPPRGLIFNTYEWGDYLLWAGPQDLQVFVASHAHLVPTEVWEAYMQIIDLGSGWDEQLDRYGVNTIVIDKQNRGALISALSTSTKWTLKLDDGVAVIYERKEPI